MPPRVLQHHRLHSFGFRLTATNKSRFYSPNNISYYSSSPLQTRIPISSKHPARVQSHQLAAQHSSYSSNTGTIPRDIPPNMATATNIQLSLVTDAGIYSAGEREDGARAASEILQEDLAKHHVFFNDEGFHSMRKHQLLALNSPNLVLQIISPIRS